MSEEKDKNAEKAKRKALASAVTLVTAAGVTVGSLFGSASSLLEDHDSPPSASVTMDSGDTDGDGDDGQDEQDTEKYRRRSLKAALQIWILRLPLAVRLLVILPLWGLGQGVLAVAGALWATASPLFVRIAGFALLLLVLFGTFALAAKAVFPDLPWKRLFSRRSILILLLGGLLLGAADLILAAAWPEDPGLRRIVEAGGAMAALFSAALSLALRERRRRKTEQQETSPEPEEESPRLLTFFDGAGEFTLQAGPRPKDSEQHM